MVIKMTRHKWDIDVAAFANRFAVVQRFEHREPARMFLHLPGQRIKIPCTRMWSEGLPRRKGSACGLHCAINVCCRSLRNGCKFLASGGVRCVEIAACRGRLPCAVDEMSEAAAMAVQPRKGLARVLWRRPILHGHEFFDDAHSFLLASLLTESWLCRSCNRMAII